MCHGGGLSETLASLAGVVPHPQDIGTRRGTRSVGGGCPAVRKALYQMTQTALRCNPVINTHYRHLRHRMAHKPAVIACARRMPGIVYAMLRDGLTWQQTKVGQGQFLPDAA